MPVPGLGGRREYGGTPGDHPVWKEQATQQLMESKRGSPGWTQMLIDGFLDIRKETVERTWETIEDLYRKESTSLGNATGNPLQLQGRMIRPPRVSGYMQTLESQLFTREPKFFIEPLSARQEKLAIYAEQHANADWRRCRRLSNEMHLALRDCAKTGWSWVYTSYTPREKENVKRERARRDRLAEQLQDPMLGPVLADEIVTSLMGPDSIGYQSTTPTFERDDRAMRGYVASRRIPYWMVACDPNGSDTHDIEWWSREIICPIQAVKGNTSFKNTSKLKPTGVISAFKSPHTGRQEQQQKLGQPEPYQYVALWETFIRNEDGLWDLKIHAEGHPDWLYEQEVPYDVGLPVSCLRWNQDGDHIITPSDIQQVLDLIVEEVQLRTRLFDATMREYQDVALVDLGKIPEQNLRGLINVPGVGLVIPVKGMGQVPVKNFFEYLPKPQKAEALLSYLAILERNIELGLGLGANQQLSALKSETSATEAAEIASWARARSSVKHEYFEKFVAEIEFFRLCLGFQFYGPEMFAHTVSREGLAFLMGEKFTHGDIQNGLAVSIEKGSMKPPSDEARMELYTTMIQEAMANPLLLQVYNLPEIVKRRTMALGIMDGSELLLPADASELALGGMQMAMMQMMGMGGAGGAGEASPPATGGNSSTVEQVQENTSV